MPWHKLSFPLTGEEPVKQAFVITQIAKDVDRQAGNPEGFAIFSGWEFGETNESTNFVLYFSPVAASCCGTAFGKVLTPCDKPDPDGTGLGIAYGDLLGPAFSLSRFGCVTCIIPMFFLSR